MTIDLDPGWVAAAVCCDPSRVEVAVKLKPRVSLTLNPGLIAVTPIGVNSFLLDPCSICVHPWLNSSSSESNRAQPIFLVTPTRYKFGRKLPLDNASRFRGAYQRRISVKTYEIQGPGPQHTAIPCSCNSGVPQICGILLQGRVQQTQADL